ncbi:2Fe-2S iron-sulfur cluster-binding protein [Alkalilimnicola sp. S0819]|uniref:2Fe-2S iron-sulfur cluster-binding protein n=1 Tax=Alkalilimnicola sp. S0819 TaxID=2613922 RepID=UPI0012621DE3|nr:2Fe-2S iron-sulfur cluster-binding protein [Alkalilimnicola sp. S0819]KAB7623327.1 2Fe-2S iron-sulfur cluster binding domain-containing protein [Alkalilimnicola sp. S0819]MPQ16865.1 2Fe-2S iron-sulfur cluster binding domain-containing protein [Alkalilimnicola sp. S0819]
MERREVTILDTGERYPCAGGRHILGAMASLGRKGIPSGCHGGGCGVCKVRIVSGECSTLAMCRSHVSVDEQAQGYVLACRAFPQTDVSLEVVGGMRKAMLKHGANASTQRKKYGFV